MSEDNHPQHARLSNNKMPIDDIIDHITADLQSYDGQYILLGQPPNSSNHTIWHQYGNNQPESQNFVQNSYSYDNRHHSKLPVDSNMMYTSNTFVDMSNGNFMPYLINNSNQYTNTADPRVNYLYYQQNTPTTSNDYGLFENNVEYQSQPILENLVGNWTSNPNGTYSPFGTMNEEPMDIDLSPRHFHEQHYLQQQQRVHHEQQHHHVSPMTDRFGNIRKPRAVAEVRPMRPTYSDVLAKSINPPTLSASNGVPSKPTLAVKADTTRAASATKTKKANSSIKNGNGAALKRQHSSGSEEQMLNGGSQNSDKKNQGTTNENVQWTSLEDLDKYGVYRESNESLKKTKSGSNKENKKNAQKSKGSKENDRTNSEMLNNHKVMNGNSGDTWKNTKKNIHISNNLQWGVGKQIPSPQRNEKKNKTSMADNEFAKKGSNGINKNNLPNGDINIDGLKTPTSKVHPRFVSPPTTSKKLPRAVKRRDTPSQFGLFWKRWSGKTSEYVMLFVNWFLNLLWDVIAMSFQLCFYLLGVTVSGSFIWFATAKSLFRSICTNPRNWWDEIKNCSSSSKQKLYNGRSAENLSNAPTNIPLPSTGEEAMKRLLACKGKDAYSILGVTKICSDEVIKRYYKRQAVLVHPDKNNQPGAEEAFKILVHAFDLIGEPEKRKAYDRFILESNQVDKVWGEFNNLLSQLHRKMEYAANTIRCTNCGQRHRRMRLERPIYASRYCGQCKIHHSSREGDIWAESVILGWMWKYYACMEGAVYDISEWANCQQDNLRHIKPNQHVVQYRIVVGKHKTSNHQPQPPPAPGNSNEPDLDDFLSSLYGHSGNNGNNNNTNNNNNGNNNDTSSTVNDRMKKKCKKKTK